MSFDPWYKAFVCMLFQPTKENTAGPKNNVITVKKQDFEVFEALDMDSISSASSTQYRKLCIMCEWLSYTISVTQQSFNLFTTVSGSPPGTEYIQDAPSYKPWEKIPGPPILPPHLLQVILNKDTPLSVSPLS